MRDPIIGVYWVGVVPLFWVAITRSGVRWLVPAIVGGWKARVPYNGPTHGDLPTMAFPARFSGAGALGLPARPAGGKA